MTRTVSYIIFLLLLTFVYSRQYTKCELFQELKTKYQLEEEEAAKWTCIGGGIANYNTSFYLGDLEYGILGLFGIQAIFWCASEWDGQVCGVLCDKFVDDDISDDLRCARDFILKDYQGSFDTWYKYREERCELKWVDIVDDCKGNEIDENGTTTLAPMSTTKILETSVRMIELEEHVTEKPERTTEKTTTQNLSSTTTAKPPVNTKFPSLASSDLRSVIDNPCKYMKRLQELYNLTKEQTTAWTCITLNVSSCYNDQNHQNKSCHVTCNASLGEHCPELANIVDGLARNLPKIELTSGEIQVNDCKSHLGSFLDNWCRLTKNATTEERLDIDNELVTSTHEYKEEDFGKFSSEEVDDDDVTNNQTLLSSTEMVEVSTETTEPLTSSVTPETTTLTSTTTVEPVTSSVTPETTTFTSLETTTRGVLDLNYSSIIENPCATIFLIAQNYNMNKAEGATWLCVLRDLTFCQYNCGVDCNTAKRYGVSNMNYCEELSQTIVSIFPIVKDALTPLFSLIHFNNCQMEIFPFAVGVCPQLGLLRD